MLDYQAIDADNRTSEPARLTEFAPVWTLQVPARFRDRAPHVERNKSGAAYDAYDAAARLESTESNVPGAPRPSAGAARTPTALGELSQSLRPRADSGRRPDPRLGSNLTAAA